MKHHKKFYITFCILFLFLLLNKKIHAMDKMAQENINLGNALINSKFIKNIYLHASKDDHTRILIRTLWHIFYGNEDDQLLPTQKGPLAIITPEILQELILYSCSKTINKEKTLINKLIYRLQWAKLYATYLPIEIQNIEKIQVHLNLSLKKINIKTNNLNQLLQLNKSELLNLNKKYKEIIKSSKKEKSKLIKEVNKKFPRKSKEKANIIQKIVNEIDLKYNLTIFKKEKHNINTQIINIKEKIKHTIKEKKNILDEIKNKILEYKNKQYLLENKREIPLEIEDLIETILETVDQAQLSKLYLPKTTIGILHAFYSCKFDAKKYINKKTNKLPDKIKLEKFAYQYTENKTTEKFSDCFESSMLDLLNLLLYNPNTQSYDETLIPEKLQTGIGYKKLKKALKCTYLANAHAIEKKEYTQEYKYISFTSLKKLKQKLYKININKQIVKNTKLENINPLYMQSEIVRQAWINIVSKLDNIDYNQPTNKCEILPRVHNIINLLNYFYNTKATTIKEFGPLLYTKNRALTFTLEKSERPIIHIQINHKKKLYSIQLTLMDHHCVLTCPQRNINENNIYENKQAQEITKNINANITRYNKQTPLFISLANKELLSPTINLHPILARSLYYLLNIKDPIVKLAIITHALKNTLLKYIDIKKLVLKFKTNLMLNNKQLQCKLISVIIKTLAYKKHSEFKKLLIKHPSKALAVLSNIHNNKISKKDFYFLYNLLLKNKANINSIWEPDGNTLLKKAIQEKYLDIIIFLLKHKKLKSKIKNKSLEYAAYSGHVDIFKLLLKETKISPTKVNSNNNTPLHIAALNNKTNMLEYLLNNLKFNINQPGYKNRTAINIAAKNNLIDIAQILLSKPDINVNLTDHRKYTPLNRAAFKGNIKVVKALLKHKNIDPNIEDFEKFTALISAAYRGHATIVDALLHCPKINVNKQDKHCKTALYWASSKGYPKVVKKLLQHKNININIANNKNKTPLDKAIQKNHTEIISLLKNYKDI